VQAKQQILVSIKLQVQQVLPDADIILFGSRANGHFSEESDWDILVLSGKPVTKKVKQEIHDKIFPLSVSISAFINVLVVSRNDWQQDPSYYSLKKTIALNNQPI
jgi:predicted nucleotidyltransferase